MKKRSCALLLALCLLLILCACDSGHAEPSAAPAAPAPESTAPAAEPSPEPTPELSQREKDWIEDIEFLRKEYKAQHMDPFYLRSEEESDWALDHLISQVGSCPTTTSPWRSSRSSPGWATATRSPSPPPRCLSGASPPRPAITTASCT